jgi:hypothetical protein
MSAPHPLGRNHPSREWLAGIAIIYGGVFFILPTLLQTTLPVFHPLEYIQLPAINWIALNSFEILRGILFSSIPSYLIASMLGLCLIATALFNPPRHGLSTLLLLVTLCGILAYPFANRYRPALVAAPGYEMRIATQADVLNGVVKSAQKTLEVTPCQYTLLGWSSSEQLYYAEQCRNGNSRTWLYDLAQDRAQAVIAPPRKYSTNTCSDLSLADWVRAPAVYPATLEPQVRLTYLQGNSLPAPNCQWVATVARHGYGPEDVILLKGTL